MKMRSQDAGSSDVAGRYWSASVRQKTAGAPENGATDADNWRVLPSSLASPSDTEPIRARGRFRMRASLRWVKNACSQIRPPTPASSTPPIGPGTIGRLKRPLTPRYATAEGRSVFQILGEVWRLGRHHPSRQAVAPISCARQDVPFDRRPGPPAHLAAGGPP